VAGFLNNFFWITLKSFGSAPDLAQQMLHQPMQLWTKQKTHPETSQLHNVLG
jgi:hypothetical protein